MHLCILYLTFLLVILNSWLHDCVFSQTTEEGATISCVIERMRGSLDHVYVNYSVSQLDSLDDELPAHQDFVNATGAVLFMPGQRSEVCVLLCVEVTQQLDL